jgi:uncharacterized membrane protein YdjX (TVP38/TMEM64 family)
MGKLFPNRRRSLPLWLILGGSLLGLLRLAQSDAGPGLQPLMSGLVGLPAEWPKLLQTLQAAGWLGVLGFIGLYVGAAVLVLPCTVMALSAGAIYGPVLGVLYALLGALLGAAVAFWLGRYVAHDWVQRQIAKTPIAQQPTFQAVRQAIGTGGAKVVLLTRLSPLFPFSLLNYAYALTEVKFMDYLIGTLGVLPVTAMYVYLGAIAVDVAAIDPHTSQSGQWVKWALQGMGGLATIGVMGLITQLARRELARQTDLTVDDRP